MSDVNLGPVAGIALYALFRAVRDARKTRKAGLPLAASSPPGPLSPSLRSGQAVPERGNSGRAVVAAPQSRATLQCAWPIPPGLDLTVPVERWQKEKELLGWRFWGLGRVVGRSGPKGRPGGRGQADDGRERPFADVRLRSFRAPYAWDGPVLRAHRLPSESPFSRAGVYALKSPKLCNVDLYWDTDECWVAGWVALSGRVVEHERGYRAERAVIRRLRLGVATHLHLPHLEDVMALAAELERRYQAPVDLPPLERNYALWLLEQHPGRWGGGIPELAAGTRS